MKKVSIWCLIIIFGKISCSRNIFGFFLRFFHWVKWYIFKLATHRNLKAKLLQFQKLYNVCFKKTGTKRSSVLQLRFVPVFLNQTLQWSFQEKKWFDFLLVLCPQFYIQLVFKAPLCITLTISDQKIVSGSLFLTKKNSSQFEKKNFFFSSNFLVRM